MREDLEKLGVENQISDQFHNDGVMDDIKTLLRKFKD